MANNFSALKELIASLESDFDKFYNKGNSAAGTRVRKGMQDLKNLAQQVRAEVQQVRHKMSQGEIQLDSDNFKKDEEEEDPGHEANGGGPRKS